MPDYIQTYPSEIVDFTRSIPPIPTVLQVRLMAALADMARDQDIALRTRTVVAGGNEYDRLAAAKWLAPRFGGSLPVDRLAVTSGTQSALFLLLEALVGKDGLLLAESLSWGSMGQVAHRAHIRLKGIAIDDDGIIPEAFEAACRDERPRALYCNPTDQNPTTAIMPEKRRRAIAEIARRYNVPIIEDDALGLLHPKAPPPIAALAPDITWYVMGLTKCLSHGLRLAYLSAPSSAHLEQVLAPARRLSFWSPAPLSAEVTARLIANGAAEDILRAIREESEAREALAANALAGADIRTKPGGMHLWLHLPRDRDRHDFAQELKRLGVLVRPAELFAVDETPPPNAVRLSLSSPLDRGAVKRGIDRVAQSLNLHPKE